jgi:hypothetical protein
MTKFNRTQKLIEGCDASRENYEWIMGLLIHIGRLPFKNKEMTSVLTCNFIRKFRKFVEPDEDEVNYPVEGIKYRERSSLI